MICAKDLDYLAEVVSDNISNINYGGCCVFAALIAKHLQHFFDVRIIVFSHEVDITIDEARSHIQNNIPEEWNLNGIYFGHVVIEYVDRKGNFNQYDSEGITKSDRFGYSGLDRVEGYLTIDETISLANEADGWNDCFNREQIPKMKEIIDNFFEPYLMAI